MGRPPLPVGTWGDINVQTTASGRYEARTRYRDYDGVTRYVRRAGDTPRKAKTALTAALADRARTVGEEITAESRLTDLATMWAETLNDRSDATPTASPSTTTCSPPSGKDAYARSPPRPSSAPSTPSPTATGQPPHAEPAPSCPRSWASPSGWTP